MDRQPHTRAAAGALAALALAVLVAPAPAAAQPRKDPAAKATPRGATTPAATPSTRSAAPASIPVAPAAAAAPVRSRGPGWLSVAAGVWAGFDAGQGPALVADYGYLRTPASWKTAELELHVAASVGRGSKDTPLTTTALVGSPLTISAGVEKQSAWIVEVVPFARVRLPVGPKVSLLVDGGVGLSQTVESYDRDELYAGRTKTTQNQTSLVVHVGGGMTYALSERARVVVVPLALSLQLGTGFSAYVPTLGLAYRL